MAIHRIPLMHEIEAMRDYLREHDLIDDEAPAGTLKLKCPVCGQPTLFDPKSQIEKMLVICIDSNCPWTTKLGPLRTAVLKALK